MKALPTSLRDVLVLEPQVWSDERGDFWESFSERTMRGLNLLSRFVQDNHSHSSQNVLRGLHYQVQHPQGKIVRVVSGGVFDVAVDLRRSSADFGKWTGIELSAENRRMLWIPEGFAHGFFVVRGPADFIYKTTDFYFPEHDRTIRWNDPDLNIQWPTGPASQPIVSPKDAAGVAFRAAEVFD